MHTTLIPQFKKNSHGFTLFELMIGIAIITILASIVSFNFAHFRENQAVSNGVDDAISLVNEARSRTLAGDGGTTYGVHLDTSEIVLFAGSSYTPGDILNKVVKINPLAKIDSISLLGGGSDIMFEPLTGDTMEYGSFIVKRVSSTAGQKTVTLSRAGEISSN